MGIFADRNRIYIALIYLAVSFVYIALVLSVEKSPTSLLGYMMVLVIIIVATHDTLLRVLSQSTGHSAPISELSYFSAFIDLNKKIHHLSEVDDVISSVDKTLRERVYITTAHYFLSSELPSAIVNKVEGGLPTAGLISWSQSARHSVELTALARESLKKSRVCSSQDVSYALQEIFEVTQTNLLIPVIQNGKILALLLLGRADNAKPYSDVEMQAYNYLADQLTLILDRIRVYAQVVQKTAMEHAEKLQVMQSLSANIAHEMRTPLSGIRASISGVEEYLPQLLESHLWCMEHAQGQFPVIRDSHLNALTSTPRRIKLMIDQANTVIDMLLMNLRENALDRKQFNLISARDIIEQALDRYPFKSGQREKLLLTVSDDFTFLGVESLCIYLLFNLLKNAFYSLQSAQKGEISILVQKLAGEGQICFRDTGIGINSDIISKIFDGFFTTKQEGTGVGLAFCKRTIESFNGRIACDSEMNCYTEFVITLPITPAAVG